MKPAFLVIDVQKEFFKSSAQTAQSLNGAIEYINAAIAIFRAKNLPIFCIQHINEEDKLIPGAEGFDLPEGLQILPSDGHIHKTYSNAFNKTGLEMQIKGNGCRHRHPQRVLRRILRVVHLSRRPGS